VKDEIERGISSNRIFIGGFSQGGAVTLNCMLRSPFQLGGFIAASSWLVGEEEYPAKLSSMNLETPLFMGHVRDFVFVISLSKHIYLGRGRLCSAFCTGKTFRRFYSFSWLQKCRVSQVPKNGSLYKRTRKTRH